MPHVKRALCVLCPATVLAQLVLAPVTARADAFDDMRQTFQTDIPHFFTKDVPHFFQDDIPCAFGGKPTSGARTSCDARPRAARPSDSKDDHAPAPVKPGGQ